LQKTIIDGESWYYIIIIHQNSAPRSLVALWPGTSTARHGARSEQEPNPAKASNDPSYDHQGRASHCARQGAQNHSASGKASSFGRRPRGACVEAGGRRVRASVFFDFSRPKMTLRRTKGMLRGPAQIAQEQDVVVLHRFVAALRADRATVACLA